MSKVCRKCNLEKQLVDYYRAPKNKDGRASYCKECVIRMSCKDEVVLNKRLSRLKDGNYNVGIIGKICTNCKTDKTTNSFPVQPRGKLGRASKCKECINLLYNKSGKRKASLKKWQQSNKEKLYFKNKVWRKNNPTKVKELKIKWNKANPDKVSAMKAKYKHKRRAAIKDGRRNDLTTKQICELKTRYTRCMLCDSCDNLTIEHFIPISMGGENTLDNIGIFCSFCNNQKNNKTLCEFIWLLTLDNDIRMVNLLR